MNQVCHRCERDLPDPQGSGGERGPATLDNVINFCPSCGAPQVRLPEYLRTQSAQTYQSRPSTGALPPPRPGSSSLSSLDWQIGLRSAFFVAATGSVLALLSMVMPFQPLDDFASLLSGLLVLCGAFLTVGIYARLAPATRLNARHGWRLGLVTGLLIVATRLVTLGAAGFLARFILHRMGSFDASLAQVFAMWQAQTVAQMPNHQDAVAFQVKSTGIFGSPEALGGMALAGAAFYSAAVLLLSGVFGAFAGLLRNPRAGLNREA
jgi:hypothetical protein